MPTTCRTTEVRDTASGLPMQSDAHEEEDADNRCTDLARFRQQASLTG